MGSDRGGTDNGDMVKSTAQLTDAVPPNAPVRDKLKKTLRRTVSLLAKTTVEPCVLLYMISVSISALAVKSMNQDKACRMNLGYSDEICDRIVARNASDLKEEHGQVQTLYAKVASWEMPLQTALPALLVLFVGAWSDRTRRRKVCILAPMVGEMTASAGLLLSAFYMREWSLEMTALIEALPPALTGGWIMLFMGVYSYITDLTSVEERTFRLGVLSMFGTLGTPAGNAFGGVLLRYLGYYGVFSLVMSLHAIALTYGLIFLKDVEVTNVKMNKDRTNCLSKFFAIPLRDTFMVLFKIRTGRRRFLIIAALLLYFLMVGPLYGDAHASFLYSAYKFNFSTLEFSLYSTFNTVAGLIGLVCMTVLIRLVRIEDSVIGMMASTSRIAACFVFALAPTRGWFYSAPAVNIFSHSGLMAVRSMSSKLVPKDEFAKLSSLIGVCEGLAPCVYTPCSNAIYIATLKILPGAFYLFDAALTVLALALFVLCFALREDLTEERHSESGNNAEYCGRTNECYDCDK